VTIAAIVEQEHLEAGLQQVENVLQPVAHVAGVAVAEQQRRQRVNSWEKPGVQFDARLRGQPHLLRRQAQVGRRQRPVRVGKIDEPIDQRKVEARKDVLVYSTGILKESIEATGPVKVILYASSSAMNTDFTAKLVDVCPDGRAIRLCEGIIRASFRNPEAPPSAIQPNKVYKYNISLWSTSNLFKEGHQIRVEISSSNFPRFDRNLNTGIFPAIDTTFEKATQTIYHSREYPSCIVLPVIE